MAPAGPENPGVGAAALAAAAHGVLLAPDVSGSPAVAPTRVPGLANTVMPATGAASALTPSGAQSVPACSNCGSSVPGNFCGNCGQRLHSPVHSVWHFVQEATEDLTHADSRLWRTLLALLLKPGFLTREFLNGRRASYLPPVRLYLVLSVVFFLLAASGGGRVAVVGLEHPDRGAPKLTVSALTTTPHPGESLEQRQARICGRIEYHGWWSTRIEPAMRKGCTQYVADQGHAVREAFYHALPRAMFVFLPLLAGLMTLLYRHPRRYYIEHLLLLLHNHAFVFLTVAISWLLQRVLPGTAASLLQVAVQIYVTLYVYRSMRRVYGQGRLLTAAKFLVMSWAYMLSAGIMVLATILYSTLSL
jgi:hypothetical protein